MSASWNLGATPAPPPELAGSAKPQVITFSCAPLSHGGAPDAPLEGAVLCVSAWADRPAFVGRALPSRTPFLWVNFRCGLAFSSEGVCASFAIVSLRVGLG